MTALEVLSAALALAFLLLAAWTLVHAVRFRTRSLVLLATAFTSLGVAIVLSRLDQLTSLEVWPPLLQALNIVLVAFPWLVAAAVWSLAGRRPRWAVIGAVGVPLISLWLVVGPVTGDPPHPFEVAVVLLSFGGLWLLASVGAAVILRRAARDRWLARPRMRLIATGILTLALALLVDLVIAASGELGLLVVMNAVALVAATLLLLGFLPPRALRLWWRRDSTASFQRMQADLLGAVSREDVAAAVTRPLALLLGSGVVVVADTGEVLDHDGVDPEVVTDLAQRVLRGAELGPQVRAASIGRGWLLVIESAYTPVFGKDERDLAVAYASQIRIALERAQLFESIATQQRDLEAMLLGLAHDIRSPTAAIAASNEMLADSDDVALRRELIDIIASSTAYLSRLVDAMLELGDVRTREGERRQVDLERVARDAAERVCAAHPSVTVEVRSDGSAASMSPVRAEQLFDNLLGNAAKHGGEGDLTVLVEIGTRDGEVEIVVGDDGVGIPVEDREQIFTPFQRGTAARGAGNGLGLGLVRRIVEDNGGRLRLEEAGRGARFAIRLPAALQTAGDGLPG